MKNTIIFSLWLIACTYALQTKRDMEELDRLKEKEQTIGLKKFERERIKQMTILAKSL